MNFNPVDNIQDKEKLRSMMEEFYSGFFKKMEKKKGSITIGDKTYEFFGWGPWVTPWEAWYLREMDKINSDVTGYNKTERWNAVGTKITQFKQMTRDQLPSNIQIVDEFFSIMSEPDRDPKDPELVEKEWLKIWKRLKDTVLKRLMPGVDIPDDQVPIIWDQIRKHVGEQQAAAISFLGDSEDLAGIVAKTLQESENAPPQKHLD